MEIGQTVTRIKSTHRNDKKATPGAIGKIVRVSDKWEDVSYLVKWDHGTTNWNSQNLLSLINKEVKQEKYHVNNILGLKFKLSHPSKNCYEVKRIAGRDVNLENLENKISTSTTLNNLLSNLNNGVWIVVEEKQTFYSIF